MKNLKKLMAILLCLVMVMSMLPMSVFAEDSTTPGGSVTITPKTATVTRGEALQFTAVATPEEGYPMGHLEWSVTEVDGVSITDAGLLVVEATVPVDTALTVTVEAYCGATADTSVLFATDTATVTVTAPAPVYTITFDANGGDALTPNSGTTDTAGKLASLPTPTHSDPTKTFVGWFDASEGGNAVTGDTVYVADTTVYAQWETNYIITDGADSTYQNTITQLVQFIKVNAPIEKFTGVTVDGVEVAKENYTAVSGSTIITFTEAYLKSLSVGEHAVSILFEDDVVSTKLTTKGAPELYVGGVGMVSGEYLDTAGKLSFTAPADNYAYYKDGALTLVLEGTNSLIYSGELAVRGVYVVGLTVNGTGALEVSGTDIGLNSTKDITVESGTVIAEAEMVALAAKNKVSITGGRVLAKSTDTESDDQYYALYSQDATIDISDTLYAQASTGPNGFNPVPYEKSKNTTYDWVKIGQAPEIWVGGVGMESGDYLNDAGALSLTEPAGGYAHYEDGVLTLSSYTYFGDGYEVAEDSYAMIYKKGVLTVVTVGYNKLSGTEGKDVVAVLAEGAVTMQGEGTVALISKGEGISAQGDITINSGEVTIDTGYDGLSSDEGDVVIKGGTVTITAEGDGIWTTEGGVTLAGGTVDITAEGDAICVYDSSVTISGGTLTAAGGTDGIYAAETISITAGDVLVKSVNEEEDDYFSALYADEIDIAATLTALASEVPEGTDPELFDLDKFDSYDWVRIGSASEVIAVKLSRTALTMNVGGTEDLTATVLGKADGYAPVWTSSDPAVATVDENGKVTAVSVGEAVITATLRENGEVLPADMDDEISDSCTVTVTDEPTTFIEVNKVWAGTLADGESHPGSVTVYLTKNGERVADGKAVLSAGNNWTYTWNNLPAKDSDGSAVKYGVEEETVYGYTAEIKQGSTANYFTITNTVVPKEAVTHTVKYDANGGKGTMSSDTVDDGEEYTLRTNKFTAPKGKVFKCWKIGTKVYSAGEKITVEGDVTVKAVWKTKTDVPQTGDSGEIVLWGAVLGVSVAALAVIGVVAWKKKKDQE